MNEYLKAVQQVGFETVMGDISEETQKRLNMPLMSVTDYIKYIGMD